MPQAPSLDWTWECHNDPIVGGVQLVGETEPDVDAHHIGTWAPGTHGPRDLAGIAIVGS